MLIIVVVIFHILDYVVPHSTALIDLKYIIYKNLTILIGYKL